MFEKFGICSTLMVMPALAGGVAAAWVSAGMPEEFEGNLFVRALKRIGWAILWVLGLPAVTMAAGFLLDLIVYTASNAPIPWLS